MSSHRWFIEPLDIRTNEILAKNQEFLCEAEVYHGVKCSDGRAHQFWGCTDYAFVSKLQKSRVSLGAVFVVWHQEGRGQIREWIFPKKKSKRQPK